MRLIQRGLHSWLWPGRGGDPRSVTTEMQRNAETGPGYFYVPQYHLFLAEDGSLKEAQAPTVPKDKRFQVSSTMRCVSSSNAVADCVSDCVSHCLCFPHSVFVSVSRLSCVLVVVMKAKELKTKISHTHSLMLSRCLSFPHAGVVSVSHCLTFSAECQQ